MLLKFPPKEPNHCKFAWLFLAYLLSTAIIVVAVTWSHACAAIPKTLPTVNQNEWLTMNAVEGVMAWKIYTGDNSNFSKATYQTTIWIGNDQPASMHCDIVDACGREVHLFATAMRVKIGMDCEHFLLMQSSPAYMLWKTF